jgi:hypothetical protein
MRAATVEIGRINLDLGASPIRLRAHLNDGLGGAIIARRDAGNYVQYFQSGEAYCIS